MEIKRFIKQDKSENMFFFLPLSDVKLQIDEKLKDKKFIFRHEIFVRRFLAYFANPYSR